MRKPVKWCAALFALLLAFAFGRGDLRHTDTDLARAREAAYNEGYHAGFDAGVLSVPAAPAADHEPSRYVSAPVIDGLTSSPFLPSPTEPSSQPQESSPIEPPTEPGSTQAVQPNHVASAANDQNAGQIVFVTKSGTKYHVASCSHLGKSSIEKTLSDALSAGYTPCKTCKP